jgi:myo-inositol-1(or 4)-monophosphatase
MRTPTLAGEARARYDLGREAIRKAGAYLKGSFGRERIDAELPYDTKLAQDRESEQIITGLIGGGFPGDGFLAEETGAAASSSGYVWTIDPLDGTVNYSRRIPHACVSIACRRHDAPLFGLVYDFVRDELFAAQTGGGASLNGEKIAVSRERSIDRAVAGFGLMKGRQEILSGMTILQRLGTRVRKIRMFGAAALDLCYLACGRLDVFVELGLKEWDVAAGRIILAEAGGAYAESLHAGMGLIIATNGIITTENVHEEIETEEA